MLKTIKAAINAIFAARADRDIDALAISVLGSDYKEGGAK